ncbi:MAG: DinB family protein [Bacteroidetes bacterium]|nr:DinB family protein [Bacteroidota bacterium]
MSKQYFARPSADEYAPYYETYVRLVPDGGILEILEAQLRETLVLLRGLSEAQAAFAYAEGKWSVKEVIGHIIDTERVFAYRGLCFARGDSTPLPGFEQDDYVLGAGFNARSTESLAGEFEHMRHSNIYLFSTWSEAVQARHGTANGNSVTARAIPFILAGHERHHLNILRERYMP